MAKVFVLVGSSSSPASFFTSGTMNLLIWCRSLHSQVDYNVQIRESGKQYNETIEVDTERQTELIKVPAHGNVDQSNILHDFKKVSIF